MKKNRILIIGGIAVGTIAIIALVMRKKTLANTGPSYVPTGNTASTPASPAGTTGTGSPSGLPAGPVGKNAYASQQGLTVRSSPGIDNGFLGLGWGSNFQGTINSVGKWMGIVQGTAADENGDKNPATGQPYTWYDLKINSTLLIQPADKYYVREDYVNLR